MTSDPPALIAKLEAATEENAKIPEEVLTETWYAFMHDLLAEMQKAYRHQKVEYGIDQKDIAKRIGRDPAAVSRCLSGQQNMTIRTMHIIARGMNCRLKVSVSGSD